MSDGVLVLDNRQRIVDTNPAMQRMLAPHLADPIGCLLYTSDAADERSSVDLGGRRIIKKKNTAPHSRKRAARRIL